MNKIYVLKEKGLDMFGDDPQDWKNKGFTENIEVAYKWLQSTTMYSRHGYEALTKIEDF